MKNNKLYSNVLALFFIQIANYIAPLLILPYLSRVLGLDGFGYIAVLLSFCGLLGLIVDYGFNLSATAQISKKRNDKLYINELISIIFCIKTMIVITVVAILFIVSFFYPNVLNSYLLFYITILLVGQSLQTIWYFQGTENMKKFTYVTIISKLFYLFFTFILVKSKSDIDYVILSLALSFIFSGAFNLVLLYREGVRIVKLSISRVICEVKFSFSFFISRLFVSAYTQASTIVIGHFSGAGAAGIYGSSEKLYQAAQSASSPVISALYPFLVKNKNEKLFYRLIFVCAIFVTCCTIFSIMNSKLILTVFFGKDFVVASDVFSIFMCIVPISFVSMCFGYPAFALINNIKLCNVTVMIAASIHITVLLFLIYLDMISPMSVVSSLLITEIVVLLLRVSLYFKYKKLNYELY